MLDCGSELNYKFQLLFFFVGKMHTVSYNAGHLENRRGQVEFVNMVFLYGLLVAHSGKSHADRTKAVS